MSNSYQYEVEISIGGDPIRIGVISFEHVPPYRGSAMNCDSDWDYYGYTEVEWEVINDYDPVTQPDEYDDIQHIINMLPNNKSEEELVTGEVIRTLLGKYEDDVDYNDYDDYDRY
jgi:hypothetical protein